MVGWPQCVRAAVAASQLGPFRCRYFVDMWVAEGHTTRWIWLCGLFGYSVAVWEQTGAGHAHAVAMSDPGIQQVPMVVRPSWEQWSLRGCVCVPIAVVQPTLVTPDGREAWEEEGATLWHSLVGLCFAVMGLCDRRFGPSWRHPIDT